MKNKENLNIDYSRHVEYLPKTKAVLTKRLEGRFGKEEGQHIWANAKHLYEEWCRELPYTGGAENPQCHSIYDSIMCFAYWEAIPEGQKERLEEFTDTVSLVFCGCLFDRELLKSGTYSSRKNTGRIMNGNNRFLLKRILPIIRWRFQKIVKMKKAGK